MCFTRTLALLHLWVLNNSKYVLFAIVIRIKLLEAEMSDQQSAGAFLFVLSMVIFTILSIYLIFS